MSDAFTKIVESARGNPTDENGHFSFFDPLNEMDPLVKPKNSTPKLPKFKFRIFKLAGVGNDLVEDSDYTEVMNNIVSGDFIRLDEQTYHSKDGDIQVFLRWLEKPEAQIKEESDNKEKENLEIITEEESKKKKKKMKKEAVNKLQDEETEEDRLIRESCPAIEPEITV